MKTLRSDIGYMSAIQLAGMIREKDISSRELLDFFLERIGEFDKEINSVIIIDSERARSEADAADKALIRGEVFGPLHGLPMTVKDAFQTANMRTTSGMPELANFVPKEDAWPVSRLREAGAIIFGKTNMPKHAGDFQSYNELFGTTNNPYDLSRTPGGSSGGSAAALACGFTPLELGSDIAGSIRIPAHMTGVVGHKPSCSIIPMHGHIPGPPGTISIADLAVAGPMARTVEDLQLGLDITAGADHWHQSAWKLELPEPRHNKLKDYRIAAWLDDSYCSVEPEVKALLNKAAVSLSDIGVQVDLEARPSFTLEEMWDTFFALLHAVFSGGRTRDAVEAYAAITDETSLAQTQRLQAMRHREWLHHNEKRFKMRKCWEEFFHKWDVILLPVLPCPAIPHDHSEPMASRKVNICGQKRDYWSMTNWMALATASYLPATVVPVGCLSNGLPIGIQIVGPHLHDRTTLYVAKHLLEMVGGCPKPGGF